MTGSHNGPGNRGHVLFGRLFAGGHISAVNAVAGDHFGQAFTQLFARVVGMAAVAFAHLGHAFDEAGEVRSPAKCPAPGACNRGPGLPRTAPSP